MKQAKKTIKKVTKMVKKFKTKNWLYVAFLAVVVFNLLRTKTTPKVMMVIAVLTALNYAVTKNVPSALGRGAIVATACMYFNHLKEKMDATMIAATIENEEAE